jgi:hypothetical protein
MSTYISNYSSGLCFSLIWIFQCFDFPAVGMKPSFLELRFPSPILCYIHCLFVHMFLGQRGNKRPGPTSSVPSKKRKCGICKQEGKAVPVPAFYVMFLWHISQTDVSKLSHNLWPELEIFNICMFCALWLTCDIYSTSPLRLLRHVIFSIVVTGMADTGTVMCVCTRHVSISVFPYCFRLILSDQAWRCGPGSVVSIATGYRLDGLRIESRWGRDFLHLSRPALGPIQPPVQWVERE